MLGCLGRELHEQHGGSKELQAAGKIPALLHVAPPAPAAAPCATMDSPATPLPPPERRSLPEHLHWLLLDSAGAGADAMHAWPLAAPALSAHRTCRCQMTTGKAHADEVAVRLPPYAVTVPTASLPLAVRLAGRLAAAAAGCAARGRADPRGSSGESAGDLDVWGSMVPGVSMPSGQRRRPLHVLVLSNPPTPPPPPSTTPM